MADPRLGGAESVNETLQDRTIRHLMYLTRLATAEANQVLGFLDNEVIPDIEDQIRRRMGRIEERGYDTGPDTTQRLTDMLSQTREIVQEGIAAIRRRMQAGLTELGAQEARWQAGVVNDVLGVDVDWTFPTARQIRDAVLKRPFDGMPLSDWFDGLSRSAQRSVERGVRLGMVEGDTVEQMVRRIRGTKANGYADGLLQTTRRSATTIARTSVIHASAQSREALYAENESLISKVQWVATLDSRTCPVCGSLDGKVYPVGEGPRPAVHGNCRCATVPLLKSARSIGLALPELPEATRASMDGGVPESLTYNGWLRRQVNAGRMDVVEDALGVSKAKAFAAGGLTVEQFVAGGREMTLDELRRKEADVFARLKL